jgi:hypothetical protein
MNNHINRCRPGFGSSCSFCCGSHNYTVSPVDIEEIFISRGENAAPHNFAHPENSCERKMKSDGMQCPNAGISPSEPGIVCCLTYNDDHAGSGFESFFKGTCKNFRCAAWDDLTDRQVLFAAELMKDWYYYSLLINSTELVLELCAEYGSPDDVPGKTLSDLKEELEERLRENELF